MPYPETDIFYSRISKHRILRMAPYHARRKKNAHV